MNRLAGITYKQLAELAERYPDENQGMSLVVVFMVPDESAKKKALSLCHFLDRQGIKAGLFFAGHQSVLSNRVEALARIRLLCDCNEGSGGVGAFCSCGPVHGKAGSYYL